jgi:Tfp pilus assembly PilM family ATPase
VVSAREVFVVCEAEEVMIVKGLVNTPDNKAFSAMLPIVETLCKEIKKHLLYWEEYRSDSHSYTHHIDKVFLCGGNAAIKGLAQYLTAILELPVETGNVWTNILSFDQEIPTIHYAESLKYSTAIGLAIRSMYREEYQPHIP